MSERECFCNESEEAGWFPRRLMSVGLFCDSVELFCKPALSPLKLRWASAGSAERLELCCGSACSQSCTTSSCACRGAPCCYSVSLSQSCCAVLTVSCFNLFLIPSGPNRRNKLSLSKDLHSPDNADVEIEKLDYFRRGLYFQTDWWKTPAFFINFEQKGFFNSSHLFCMLSAALWTI